MVFNGFVQELSANNYKNKTFNVGLRIVDFEYKHPGGGQETVTCAVWYPTEAKPQLFTYDAEENFKSMVALNAPIAAKFGPYLLIVFAHGAYGSGYNSAYFMEYLARHGYITAAPDFIDTIPPMDSRQIAFSRIKDGNVGRPLRVTMIAKRFVEYMSKNRNSFLNYLAKHRLHHTSFIIDEMIKLNRGSTSTLTSTSNSNSMFRQAIKENEIGICGHSLGGVTILGKIGAHPDKKFKDDRIKAALIFSSPAYPFEKTLRHIGVPIMLMAGDDDSPNIHPEIPRRTIYDDATTAKFYLVLKDATHFTFGNRGCGKFPLHQAVEKSVQTNAICRYGLAFFEKFVKKDLTVSGQLGKSDTALAYYIKEERAGESFEWGKEPPAGKSGGGGIRKEIRRKIMER